MTDSANEKLQQSCDELAAGILAVCETCGAKIACTESLTGGLLSDAFVRIPGASNVLLGSAVISVRKCHLPALSLNTPPAPLVRRLFVAAIGFPPCWESTL